MFVSILISSLLATVYAQGGVQKPVNVTGIVFDDANFACNFVNGESNSVDWFTLVAADNATVQVVDGEIFRMDITMADSVCKNIPSNSNATTAECPLRKKALREKFRVMVLYKHWETPQLTFLGSSPELMRT